MPLPTPIWFAASQLLFPLKACGELRFVEYINHDVTQAQFKAVKVNQT